MNRSQSHASDLAVGEIIAKDFEIVRLAGRGSFSTVYEAVQLSRQRRRVAVKMLLVGIQHELERRSEQLVDNPYLTEQALAQRIQNAVVCRVYRVGTHEGRFFAALEWVEGVTLDRFVQSYKGQVPLELAADILADLGCAIADMHRLQVVHRDLKPSNIMVHMPANRRVVVKLIDFGIAKMFGDPETRPVSNSAELLLVGTPAYMAPEQALGKITDPRSDIFSLAAAAYELLTGRRHLAGAAALRGADQFIEYLRSDLPIPAEPATAVRPELPPEVDEILGAALSRKRSGRPNTVERFIDDLEVVLRATAPRPPKASILRRAVSHFLGGRPALPNANSRATAR